MSKVNFNEKRIIFTFNNVEIVKNTSKNYFKSWYTEEEFKTELANAFKAVVDKVNEKLKNKTTSWRHRASCIRSTHQNLDKESPDDAAATGSGEVHVDDMSEVSVDVNFKDDKTVLVHVKNLKDTTKKCTWFKEGVTHYYNTIGYRSKNHTIMALIESVPPVY